MGVGRSTVARRVYAAKTGNSTDNRPHDFPQNFWFVENFVVEADREQAVHAVEHCPEIVVDRRPCVLPADSHPLGHRLHAGADVWDAVYCHQAVRAVSGHAQQTTRPVELEATAQQVDARCGEGGGYGVALVRGDPFALELEIDHGFSIDQFVFTGWEPSTSAAIRHRVPRRLEMGCREATTFRSPRSCGCSGPL